MTLCPVCGSEPGSRWYCRRCGAPQLAASERLPRPAGPWRRRLTRFSVGAGILGLTACTVLLIAAALEFNWLALAIASVAAIVPAVIYSLLVLRLDRYEREPARAVLAAFGWGAVAAVLLAVILEAITGSVLIFAVGQDAANLLNSVVGAPLIEETTKGIALLALLWWFGDEFDNVLDGLVYGALIGLGFAMTENILYLGSEYIDGGARALGELFVIRVILDGFGHAVYTATTGAAVGWSRSQYRRGIGRFIVPMLGWSLAVLQHFLWNGSLFLVSGLLGKDASLWHVVLIQAPLFTFAPLLVLWLIARVAGRRELEILRTQLAPEVAWGVLTPDEYATLTDPERRRQATISARSRGGRPLRAKQRRFFDVASDLAFRKYHLSRGERPKPNQHAPEDAYRAELAHLRAELNVPALV